MWLFIASNINNDTKGANLNVLIYNVHMLFLKSQLLLLRFYVFCTAVCLFYRNIRKCIVVVVLVFLFSVNFAAWNKILRLITRDGWWTNFTPAHRINSCSNRIVMQLRQLTARIVYKLCSVYCIVYRCVLCFSVLLCCVLCFLSSVCVLLWALLPELKWMNELIN